MKNIETVIPNSHVPPTIEKLRVLEIEDIIVEPVRVFKKNLHKHLVYRGHEYDQDFISESKLRFFVSDEDATQAEAIVANAARN